MTDLPTEPGSVIEAKPPGRRKAFLMALDTDGRWRRLDGPFYEDGPFREVRVLFDAGRSAKLRAIISDELIAHRDHVRQFDPRPEFLVGLETAASIVRFGS